MGANLTKKKQHQINVTFEVINDPSYDDKLTLWYAEIWKEIKEDLQRKEDQKHV